MRPSKITPLTIALSLSVVLFNSATAQPEINQPAPAFSAVTTTGETISNETLTGKTVVMEWTNHECPFVRKHYGSGNMQKTQQQTTEQGVVWISVVSSAPNKQGHITNDQATELTISRNAAPTYIILDESGELGQKFEAKTTPHMYVMDGEWTLRYEGAIDSIASARQKDIAIADNYVLDAVDDLAAKRDVATSQTKAYGCSIKY
ncbi:MAG: redoxin domain-containing protein [bacterium]